MKTAMDDWSPFPNSRDTSRFCRLVFDELAKRGMAFSGTPPKLESPAGKVLYLDNLALNCSGMKRSKWPPIVGEFLDTIAYLDQIEDFGTQSPDVARASLRLRLNVDPVGDVFGDVAGVNGITTLQASHPNDPFAAVEVLSRPALPGTSWWLNMQIPGAAFGVSADHLAGWGIGQEEAFELARVHAMGTELPPVYEMGPVRMVDSASMFTHQAVLRPQAFLPDAPYGWFVAVPSREHVLAVRAMGTDRGLADLIELVRAAFEVAPMSGYPLSLSPWYVPPTGIGIFGEDAEPIQFSFDPFDGTVEGVRFGPLVHALFKTYEENAAA